MDYFLGRAPAAERRDLLCRRRRRIYRSFVRPFGPARFVITIYGLEMTYKNPIARTLMQAGARACEKVVVISQNTYRITADVGIDESTLETIYLGVEPPTLPGATARVRAPAF